MKEVYGFLSGFLAALYFTSCNILLINLDVINLPHFNERHTKQKQKDESGSIKRTLKVAYYSFIRVQEVYAGILMQKNKLNLHICGVHLLNPYKTVVSHLK